jgi:uncharacterized protein
MQITTKPCVIVMAKYPQENKVKTRLSPFLNGQQSAQLAMCFLKDTLTKVEKSDQNLIVAFSPAESFADFSKIVAKPTILTEQIGNDLGDRMKNAFQFAFENYFSPVVMIGTDSPTFPMSEIENAFNLLTETECVFGKTQDGGFYLIGLNKFIPEIFENVAWSSAQTLEDCINNFRSVLGKEPKFVQDWYDIDEPVDLVKLFNELSENKYLFEIIENTAEWLRENPELFD